MKLAVPKNSDHAPEAAEARLRDQPEKGTKPGPSKSEADTQRLLHELEVHQIELEMQNEELSAARGRPDEGLWHWKIARDSFPRNV